MGKPYGETLNAQMQSVGGNEIVAPLSSRCILFGEDVDK